MIIEYYSRFQLGTLNRIDHSDRKTKANKRGQLSCKTIKFLECSCSFQTLFPYRTQTTGSYLHTSRRVCPGRRRKDVYDCRTGNRVRCECKRSLWPDLLDNHIVLIVGNGLNRSICGMHKCIPYIKRLDQIGQAFLYNRKKIFGYHFRCFCHAVINPPSYCFGKCGNDMIFPKGQRDFLVLLLRE